MDKRLSGRWRVSYLGKKKVEGTVETPRSVVTGWKEKQNFKKVLNKKSCDVMNEGRGWEKKNDEN